RAYFDLRKITDPGYKPGDDAIRNAGEICRRLGFETIIDEKPETFPASFPMSQIALYEGWYDANVSGPFTRPQVEFMPGAVAYHLHSYSAHSLRTTNEYWVGPLLAKGVTATLGCVQEPYLAGTPDMTIFTARLLYNGFSFGEAAYAGQPVLSWQTTVVGDPLYRPFGQNPEQLHDRLMQSHHQLVEWSYLRLLNLNLILGKPMADCVALLEQLGTTRESAVLTEKLGNLYVAQGKPASALHAYLQALKLDPTPQTRIRLLLTLGEKLSAAGRDEEAYGQYQMLLRDCPDYPDKLDLYRKLTPLAQKLNKTTEAQGYEAEIARLAAPPKPTPAPGGQTRNPKSEIRNKSE
ncbi:MAG TPA: TIGR03790 family protein, partial [Candidatus Sulfotelmatobacter sp.]|nr:TIGR03790 family protein [Candidatus Sulfotelmatobacter sp.]